MGRDQAGFTLLEVLVAFVIASMALAVLFQGATEGLHGTDLAAHYQEALARAQSRMASLGRDLPVQDGDHQGEDGDGFHWHTRISTIATAPLSAQGTGQSPRAALHGVEVTISWQGDGHDRQVVLRTQRTGFATAAPP
jgi:general secretion pathway protein I